MASSRKHTPGAGAPARDRGYLPAGRGASGTPELRPVARAVARASVQSRILRARRPGWARLPELEQVLGLQHGLCRGLGKPHLRPGLECDRRAVPDIGADRIQRNAQSRHDARRAARFLHDARQRLARPNSRDLGFKARPGPSRLWTGSISIRLPTARCSKVTKAT